ncbi:hypothetical protein [Natronobeatus ordinarius]|uniref:hypothetical protein n=1 Tax=Natronobeatus ordinarius TaxID=2963433 RepID=UPI0020CCF489|nr:hypothetical protein [Natronobeatus ordinarius]
MTDGGTTADCRKSATGDGGAQTSSGRDRPRLDSGFDVYRVTIRFATASSPSDRAAVVRELAEYLVVLSDHDSRSSLADRSVSIPVATEHDVAVVRTALEELPIVDHVTVTDDDRIASRLTAAQRSALAADHERSGSSRTAFGDVKRRTDALDVHELLDDPEYIEFLDDFGELTGPEDEVTLTELLTDADSSEASDRSAVDSSNDATVDGESQSTARRTVAERLIDELEREQVSDEQRQQLRELFGTAPPPSLEARVTHLQSRFHELSSYIDAMEAFIDDNGDAATLLEELRADLDALGEAVEALERCQSAQLSRLTAIDEELERLDDQTTTQVAAVEDSVSASVDRLEDRQQAIQTEVETLTERWEQLSTLFQSTGRE